MMLERGVASFLVGWWSFFSYETSEALEPINFKKESKITSLTVVGCAITKPQKILTDCFFFNPKKKLTQNLPKTSSSWILVKWCFTHQLEFHRYRRALLADHLVLSSLWYDACRSPTRRSGTLLSLLTGRPASFALKKKTSPRLDRLLGGGTKQVRRCLLFGVVFF